MQTAPGHETHTTRRLEAALLLVIVSLVTVGCGSSHSTGTGANPASAIPASTPLYAGAVVRPEGSLKTAAAAAGRTLTHQADPYLRLLTALETPGSAPLDFNRDLSSWLGPRAGIFLSSLGTSGQSSAALESLLSQALLDGSSTASAFPFSGHGVQGAILLDTTDASKASSFLDSQAKLAGAHPASYRGIAYQATPEGVVFALVDRFAVIGSEAGLHEVIDTTLGGPSLALAPGYAKLLAAAPSGALAEAYAAPATAAAANASPGLSGLLGLLAGTSETLVTLVPSTTSIALDAGALSGASGGLVASGPEAAEAVGELPAEAWLAVGLGDVSATLGRDVQGLRSLAALVGSSGGSGHEGAAALSLNGLLKGFLTPLTVLGAESAQAKRDFQSWMGSAAIFASGTGLVDLKAGIVITSTNPALSRAAVSKLATALSASGASVQQVSIAGTEASVAVTLPGFPVTLNVAAGRARNGKTKFVIGLSEPTVTSVLNPPSTLSGSASYTAASAALGEGLRPSVLVDFPTLLGLLEGVGLSEEPTISKFVPSMRTLTTLAGGGGSSGGGVHRFRLVLGLQHTE